MPVSGSAPAPHTLAIIGAGPVGLEAASAALDAGLDVHLFERGEVGAHPLAWGHVTMFTPWSANLGPSAAARLARTGWTAPDPQAHPTGRELVENYLDPLAALPELKDRLHTHAQVVAIARRGFLAHDAATPAARRAQPFRLLVRDAGGRENFLHAFAVLDATGVYGAPNRAGDGGIPARGELYLAPQMSYHLDDVLGLRRERYAGKRTLVIGGGTSAATLVCDLVTLTEQAPGTSVAWATRGALEALRPASDDPLPARRVLLERAHTLAAGGNAAVTHVGGVWVEGFEFNSATHRYRTTLVDNGRTHVEETDQVLVATGYGAPDALLREIATGGSGSADAAAAEPDFHVIGHRSAGRSPDFLLATGYRQVATALAAIAATAAARV